MVYFSVPSSSEELPTHTPKPRRRFGFLPGLSGRGGSVVAFVGTAALSGILFHFLFFGVAGRTWPSYRPESFQNAPLPHLPDLTLPDPSPGYNYSQDYTPHDYAPQTHTSTAAAVAPNPNYHELSLEGMRDMVSRTNGFFVRDFSLGLGWNNMRYIVEAALVQAQLLNRTLVLPSFIYARACEYPLEVCAEYAPMVNKGDAIGWDEWRDLPIEQQMGWRTPMSLMLNITKIREKHPVLLISDYLRLHGRSPDEEHSNGAWQRTAYHTHANIFEKDQSKTPSLFVVENWWYDPEGVIRVDYLPEDVKARGKWDPEGGDSGKGERGHWPSQRQSTVSSRLRNALDKNKYYMDFTKAKQVLRDGDTGAVWDLSSDELLIDLLQKNGWELTYTFLGALGADYTKTVVEPLLQVVPRESLRGWVDEYKRETADVLLLAGETHLYRKPGAMRFMRSQGMRNFQDIVLNSLQPVEAVGALADRLAVRMRERVQGRQWMGAHMRRGDFVRLGWAMEQDPAAHVARVKERLGRGRAILEDLKSHTVQIYDVPWFTPNPDYRTLDAPLPTDPFYIATDERNPDALDTIAAGGAVFLHDLLTMEDLREFGWPLVLTDYRAVVEQQLLSHSAFFYAHGMSSVAGGIVNMRGERGADRRTSLLD